jgi:hypothetical protein
MSVEEPELLDRSGNFAVLHLPGRRFPGVFLQGDTMSTIRDLLKNVDANALAGIDEQMAGKILEARDRLNDVMAYYESVLMRGVCRGHISE